MTKTARDIKENAKVKRLSYADRLFELGKIEIVHVSGYKDVNYQQWKELMCE